MSGMGLPARLLEGVSAGVLDRVMPRLVTAGVVGSRGGTSRRVREALRAASCKAWKKGWRELNRKNRYFEL